MRIVCPNCDTAYDAPASIVTAGRLMRCARCRTEWMPVAPLQAAAPPASPPPEAAAEMPASQEIEQVPAPPPGPSAQTALFSDIPPVAAEPVIRAPFPEMTPMRQPPRKAVIAGWVVSLMVLVAALWLVIAYRQAVMRHWPASARAYAALGYK
jgi:predicted Zn finger-like uncharacterized protein